MSFPAAYIGFNGSARILEEAQPDICLCGHIHEARAMDRVGRTLVVNAGMLAQGGYVLLRSILASFLPN